MADQPDPDEIHLSLLQKHGGLPALYPPVEKLGRGGDF